MKKRTKSLPVTAADTAMMMSVIMTRTVPATKGKATGASATIKRG
mgnify:CR=1 FL=1